MSRCRQRHVRNSTKNQVYWAWCKPFHFEYSEWAGKHWKRVVYYGQKTAEGKEGLWSLNCLGSCQFWNVIRKLPDHPSGAWSTWLVKISVAKRSESHRYPRAHNSLNIYSLISTKGHWNILQIHETLKVVGIGLLNPLEGTWSSR